MTPTGARKSLAQVNGKTVSLLSPLVRLTFRSNEAILLILEIYEIVFGGGLESSCFTCQVLSDTEEGYISKSPRDLMSQEYEELGVRFSVVEVSDLEEMPESHGCPCLCWRYPHRCTMMYGTVIDSYRALKMLFC